MIFYIFLFLFVVFLLVILSAIWPPESPWAPWWRTNSHVSKAICKLGKVDKKTVVYDLGCGDGEALIAAAKLGAYGVGIEIDPLRYFVAKVRAKRHGVSKNLIFIRDSFFDQDLSDANMIFVYLIPKTLNKLLPKFEKELKKGSKIISYRYEMNLKASEVDKKNQLFLYII